MTEYSRSTCFPHCVTSCFGVRKRRSHGKRHAKATENEKLHGNITGKLPTSDNRVDSCINGSTPQQKVNGKVYCPKSSDNENTRRPPDPVLMQPSKSTLPQLDEHLIDFPDPNGHAVCKNAEVIPEPKDTSGDCTTMNGVPNKGQPIDLSSSNHISVGDTKTILSHTTEGNPEVLVDCLFGEMKSLVPKNASCKPDVSQAIHPHSNTTQKASNREVTTSDSKEMSNIYKEDSKYHAHFRGLLDMEKERLSSLVLKWSELLSTDIDVEVQEEIRSVTGQTNLIITERFAQFSQLISRSEESRKANHQSNEKCIMASDLQGFWDMILFQVKDVLIKFERLEALRKSNWDIKLLNTEISITNTPKKRTTPKVNIDAAKNDKEKARRLAARKRIAEARQRLKEQNQETPEHGAIIL